MDEDGTNDESRNTSPGEENHRRNNNHYEITRVIPNNINNDTSTGNSSPDKHEDAPLDFSLRKRYRDDETSSSESLNSPSSSTSHVENIRSESENSFNSLNGHVKREPPDKWDQIGEPRTKAQNSSILPPYSALGMLYQNATTYSAFPRVTSPIDSHYGNNKNARPVSNSSSPKSPVSVGHGVYSSQGYVPSIPGFDSSILQNLNLSPEEVLTIYQQQIEALKDQDKYLPFALSRPHATTSPSFPSPSLPSMSPVHHLTHSRAINNNNHIVTNGSSPVSTLSLAGMHQLSNSRKRPRSLPDNQKDQAYWERRRKNNDAAKRSRDARRAKEDEIAIRAAILEQENLKLRVEVAALKNETAKLRSLLYNS